MTMRRSILLLLLGLGAAALLPASSPAQGGGPIKIGLLAPLSGAFSATGKDMLVGTEQYLDEIGRTVAGRKIELIVEDTEGTPATALTKARKLVDQDKVHVLTGGLLASTGYALQPFVDSYPPRSRSSRRTTSPSASPPGGSCAPAGPRASPCIPSGSGWRRR